MRHGDDVWRSSFLASFMDSLCHVRNKIMYVLLWRTVYALNRVLFWCATREINTKITLSWAHIQFAMQVHTLFYISSLPILLNKHKPSDRYAMTNVQMVHNLSLIDLSVNRWRQDPFVKLLGIETLGLLTVRWIIQNTSGLSIRQGHCYKCEQTGLYKIS